jgi:hypothetical protein
MSAKVYHNSAKRVAAGNKELTAMPPERDWRATRQERSENGCSSHLGKGSNVLNAVAAV